MSLSISKRKAFLVTPSDKILHTIQLAMVLGTAVVLIIFAHAEISPDIVFTSMIAGIGGLVGSRIASNGYAPGSTAPTPTGGSNGKP